ncbi:MAG TPA: IclR family transcriptional regulator [Acidimicrobiia bacterium]|jgi:DNA-binding IclR family transcriptional regulator
MPNVQSVVRAFRLLEALMAGDLGITELAERTDLPKSTVARLVRTLEGIRAVERADEDGRYRIGSEIVKLAGVASPTANLVSIVRPYLRQLAEMTGEDAGLSVPDGHRVHYIDQVSSENDIQVRDWTGERVAMHAVPSGQVILAHWPEDRLDRFLERPLNAYTDATITDPEELRKRLRRVHEDRYVWAYEEYTEGLSSVATALHDSRGKLVGAIHIHGPSYRFPAPGTADEIGEKLVETAEKLSRLIPHI